MAQVRFAAVRKSFGDVHVVRGLDVEVADGEFLVVVGPSGCGKSTVLRLLAGLETPSEGRIEIGDRVVNEVPPRDRDVAMVFQSYALYPHLTVRENLEFGLRLARTPGDVIAARVDEAAEMLGLTPLLERLPKALSGGQRQRVAMGRAIVRRPSVFLFDEPLSNLDAALRAQMRVELKRLHRELATTMVYVTHDQVEAMTMADRILLLNEGIAQQIGTPDDLYFRPANRFVAAFLGSPRMNFVRAAREGDAFVAPGVRVATEALPLNAAGQAAGEVVLGVRPHDLRVRSGARGGGAPEGALVEASADAPPVTVRATLELLEPMGWEVNLHVRVGEEPFIVRAEVRDVGSWSPGQELAFTAAPADVRVFGVDDGACLLEYTG
ncbi:MAG: ABC transporter ATP-binding protein [Deltaproteobacteria bacterium]|nr:MAG: ABC transporter ATP-binding protein [Deltaproteobacteria bacterium]